MDAIFKCPRCGAKKEPVHKTSEDWYEGTPLPEDNYALECSNCGDSLELTPWEYSSLLKLVG